MTEDSIRRFCDEDVRKLIDSQAQITTNLAVASTNLAIASNNIDWIVKTYSAEYTKLAALQLEMNSLKTTFWKYIGIGIGASAAISFIIAVISFYFTVARFTG
jgi:hypothetical protein